MFKTRRISSKLTNISNFPVELWALIYLLKRIIIIQKLVKELLHGLKVCLWDYTIKEYIAKWLEFCLPKSRSIIILLETSLFLLRMFHNLATNLMQFFSTSYSTNNHERYVWPFYNIMHERVKDTVKSFGMFH